MLRVLKALKVLLKKEVATENNLLLRFSYISALALMLCSLAACKTVDIYESDTDHLVEVRDDIVLDARKLIGSDYKYAGKGPNKFDCSGLVGYVYGKSAIKVGGSASSLVDRRKEINLSAVAPGDLVFFKRKGKVFHVSIISRVKKGQLWVIHSTTSRGVIEEEIMSSSYWRPFLYKTVSLRSYR